MSIVAALKPLLGVWKCDNSRTENIEEFLAEMGVNFVMRKLAKRGSPTMTISTSDGMYHIKTETGFMTHTVSYPLDGTEVEEELFKIGGRTKSHAEVIDGVVTVIANPIDTSRKQTVVTREIVNNELVQRINVGGGAVICTRYFTAGT